MGCVLRRPLFLGPPRREPWLTRSALRSAARALAALACGYFTVNVIGFVLVEML